MTEKDRARKIKWILMDVDGTLTDGTLLILPDGEELKSYNVRDGLGILLAHLAGIKTGIITGKISKSLEKRAEKLRIVELHQGILDKKTVLHEILDKN
ncbi:MAG: 3-deoxy-D-manno-octulosonate 8-phosphate phosphatase, partial [Candidatus Aminicenantes bacterium]|nr:3-deoxy-D-manno-octulosonate 8-phosphate phosphatase [Candidatus Aminicenantes bacterium]